MYLSIYVDQEKMTQLLSHNLKIFYIYFDFSHLIYSTTCVRTYNLMLVTTWNFWISERSRDITQRNKQKVSVCTDE